MIATTIHNNAIRALLTLAALSVFPTNNNGVLVSAAATRNLGKSGSSKFECAGEAAPNLVVGMQGVQGIAYQNTWEIIDACTGERVAKGKGSEDDEWTYLCVDEDKRYKFTMLDSEGDGMEENEYILYYNDVNYGDFPAGGSGYEVYFGDGTCCAEGESLVQGTLLTDEHPEETSYELRDTCSGEIIQFVDFDEDQRNYQSASEVCVPDDGKYRVSVSDTGTGPGAGIDGDGFSVTFPNGSGGSNTYGPYIGLPANGLGPEFGTYLDFEFGTGNYVPCPSSGKGKSRKSKR